MKHTETLFPKKSTLYLVLSALFITNAIVAEIIGSKIFSLEKSVGISPFTAITDGGFTLPAGAILWPAIFIITDIINEYFGPVGVKKISYIAVGCICFAFAMLALATSLAPADFWLQINNKDIHGNPLDINYAYAKILTQSMGIIIGSILAFLIGQIIDAYIFHYIKTKTNDKYIWLRANGSTFVSQLIDSFVVLFIAFYLFGGDNKWTINQIFTTGLNTFVYKTGMALLLTPLLYLTHKWIDTYLE